MTLIKSISGIRGTIGGAPGEGLSPLDIVKFTYAYCEKMRERLPKPEGERYKVVVGKDARLSGDMVEQLVCGTLIACGVDVVKAGFASTPTTEMAVVFEQADGGIILTASHNPKQWNALKLLNEKGEFLNAEEGAAILECAEAENFCFAQVDDLGIIEEKDYTDAHLDAVLALPEVDVEAVRNAHFKVALDAVNSVGGIIMPRLLERLGVECVCVNCEPTGEFAHNPEPLPANLVELSEAVLSNNADLGISVDPDVDRLALICEDGKPFGEEYTLVSVADYLLSRVYNEALNTGKSMEEIAAPYQMTTSSILLFITNLAYKKMKVSELLKTYPQYVIAKNKIELSDMALIGKIFEEVKISFESRKEWVHLRRSNTEPIIRIYAEASTKEAADASATRSCALRVWSTIRSCTVFS